MSEFTPNDLISQRKQDHLDLCAREDVEHSKKDNGLTAIQLQVSALPELSMADLDTSELYFGRKFSLPFLITGMTGGTGEAKQLNRILAKCAKAFNIPMGVGSQRLALEDPSRAADFQVRDVAPDIFLIANIGIAQLILAKDVSSLVRNAVDMIQADALAIHVNVLQELIQSEGNRDFRGAFTAIEKAASSLSVPVIVKEVGCGIDPKTALKLVSCGVKGIDVGGAGGTSWAWIEGKRASREDQNAESAAQVFRDWGISTADSLRQLRSIALSPAVQISATGGMRSGLDAAKCLALGAHMVGFGLPLMRAAMESEDKLFGVLEALQNQLKIAMMCSASKRIVNLREALVLS